MAHANEELIRSAYEAFGKGDLDTVFASFDTDIRWHIPGRSPLAGEYRGHQEVMGFFGKLNDLSGGTFSLELHDFLGNDEHVVVLVREQAHREDKSLDVREAHIWHVANGKATEFWGAPMDQYKGDEFWS